MVLLVADVDEAERVRGDAPRVVEAALHRAVLAERAQKSARRVEYLDTVVVPVSICLWFIFTCQSEHCLVKVQAYDGNRLESLTTKGGCSPQAVKDNDIEINVVLSNETSSTRA